MLKLPPGIWQLSLDYRSADTLTLRVGASKFTMPDRLEPLGQLIPVGDVHSTGTPLEVELSVAPAPFAYSFPRARTGRLQAVRAGTRDRLVPLHAACGKYVDWYRLFGSL